MPGLLAENDAGMFDAGKCHIQVIYIMGT
jgi:hypothetical protein